MITLFWLKESTEVAYNNVSNRKIINSFGQLNVQLKSVKVYLKLSQGVTLIAHIMTLAFALKTKLQQFTNRNESWHYSFFRKESICRIIFQIELSLVIFDLLQINIQVLIFQCKYPHQVLMQLIYISIFYDYCNFHTFLIK